MANRRTLHKTQLDEFKKYLADRGIAFRDGKGQYQVLQVMTLSEGWGCVYERNDMKEHFTVQDKLNPIVIGFYSEKRKALKIDNDRNVETIKSIRDVLESIPDCERGNDFMAEWIFLAMKRGKIKNVTINL
jgi:adenylate kinase family enzyme